MRALTVVFITLQISSIIEAKPSSSTYKMPNECVGQNFCIQRSLDYPQNEIEKVLDEWSVVISQDGGTRVGTRQGMESVCEAEDAIEPIYEIIDENDDLRYVVQIENKFTQNFSIIQCKNPGRVTQENALISKSYVDSYYVTCSNIMIKPKFVVLSHDRTKLEMVPAKDGIPMGCTCRYSELQEV